VLTTVVDLQSGKSASI